MSIFVDQLNYQQNLNEGLLASLGKTILGDYPANNHWYKIGNSKFFAIRSYGKAGSKLIDDELKKQDRSNLVFDDDGHVAIISLGKSWKNQLVDTAIDYQRTVSPTEDFPLESIEGTNPEFVRRSRNAVMSRNLKYILYRVSNERVLLLYNPLHRQYFKDYYKNLKELDSFGTNGNDKHKTSKLFPTYCSAMKDEEGNVYIDATCNCFGNLQTCKKNALLQGNMVDYPNVPDRFLAAIGTNCVCAAPSCDPVGVTDSFLTDFKNNVSECNVDVNIADCSQVFDSAGDININEATVGQRCANDPTLELNKDIDDNINNNNGNGNANGNANGNSSGSSQNGGSSGGNNGSSDGNNNGSNNGSVGNNENNGNSAGNNGGDASGNNGGNSGGDNSGDTGVDEDKPGEPTDAGSWFVKYWWVILLIIFFVLLILIFSVYI